MKKSGFSLRSVNHSMMHIIFVIIIVFCLQTPVSSIVNATSYQLDFENSNGYDKQLTFSDSIDGCFSGFWTSATQNVEGILNGSISFGRSDSVGKIKGFIEENDSSVSFSVNAQIFNQFIIGSISSDDSSKTSIMIGSINAHMPSFSFSIFIPKIGMITGSGSYDGSFLPEPTGPYHIGLKSYHLIDETRNEWFTEDETDYRELMMKIWYPTECSDFDKRSDYMDKITFSWLRNQGPVPLVTIPKNAYTFIHPYIYEDALPIQSVSFPVLLFSPGYDGVDVIYTSFIDEMVSHGYVVVSMNHPFVSGVTVFPDGRAVYIADLPGNYSESSEFLMQSQRSVIDDALFVLDTIEKLNQTDPMLSGIFDCSRVGMYGHSFGGAATMSCCYEDERIQAGFTLDGVVYNNFLNESISTPFLLMCAEQRFNHSSYDYVWNQFSNDAYQVGIIGSAHYSYTDVGVLLSHLMPFVPSSSLGFGTADSMYVIGVTRLFEKAFFDVYLKNEDKNVLVELFDDFDDVLIKVK